MKPYLFFAALGLLLGACQRHVEGDRAVATSVQGRTQAATPVSAAPATPAAEPEATAPNTPTALTADDLQFLRQHNLATLWQLNAQNPAAQNGAYGTDHYRIEFVFISVERDAALPNVYHVRGKNRYKKTVMPFAGDIVLERLSREQQQTSGGPVPVYAATGRFELREQGTAEAGVFQGRAAIDFNFTDEGELYLDTYQPEQPAARNGGYLFEGHWTNAAGTVRKPVLWADSFLNIAGEVLKDFTIGERDVTINPRYARLGWSNYWENEEWWAEAPTAQL
ncbi:hypothetical protein GCM10027048_00890 [Hymenobacter coalescens]